MKAILLLLLLISSFTSKAQSLDSMPLLREVFASLDSNFHPFAGKLKSTIYTDSIFHSIVTIEGTQDNEIYRAVNYQVYFAELGIMLSLEKARELVNQWNEILKQLAKGYKIKSDQMGVTKGTCTGYQYRKEVGSGWHIVDIFYFQVGDTNTYLAGIEFSKTK